MDYYGWKPYVPVAERRRKALREMEKRRKQGHGISPVRQDITDLETHFTRRAGLYRHLGLLPGFLKGRSAIEIGPAVSADFDETLRALVAYVDR